MIIMGTKRKPRKSNPVNDIANLTKMNVASTTGVITMHSLPSTPHAPAMGLAKGFAGSAFGIMQTIGAGKAVLGSLETLKDVDRRTKKRKKR